MFAVCLVKVKTLASSWIPSMVVLIFLTCTTHGSLGSGASFTGRPRANLTTCATNGIPYCTLGARQAGSCEIQPKNSCLLMSEIMNDTLDMGTPKYLVMSARISGLSQPFS